MNILRTTPRTGSLKGTADTKFFMGEHLTLNLSRREGLALAQYLMNRIQPIPEGDMSVVFRDSAKGDITITIGAE